MYPSGSPACGLCPQADTRLDTLVDTHPPGHPHTANGFASQWNIGFSLRESENMESENGLYHLGYCYSEY